jgi:hypothetical protein
VPKESGWFKILTAANGNFTCASFPDEHFQSLEVSGAHFSNDWKIARHR